MQQWTVKSLLDWTTTYLKEYSIDNPRHEAEYFISELLQTNRTGVYLNFERPVTETELALFKTWLLRRKQHEPIQYILGKAYFMGLVFSVGPGCFIPRFATETLVELITAHIRSRNGMPTTMLEIGGGSGAIAVSCAYYNPSLFITCVERETVPVSYITKNTEANSVADRITIIHEDYRAIEDLSPFDIIVSNPPYIAEQDRGMLLPEVAEHEPEEALFAGNDGLDFYRTFAQERAEMIRDNVYIYFEIGYNQAHAVREIFASYGFMTEIHKDLEGHARVAVIRRNT